MKQKKVIATLTESELTRIIRNEVMRYLKEEDEVDPEAAKEVEKAFTDAAAKLSAELSSIGKNVEAKEKDDAAVDAALKKQPELAKVAQEAVRRRGKALNEGKRRQAMNEEITVLFIASVALALPAIMELVGKIVKTISLFLGGSGKAGEKLIHAGHKWHGKIVALILKGLTFIPGFKSLPADKQQKVANIIHTVIVASLAVASGAGAIKAMQQGSTAMAGIEGALTAVKAGEIGVGKFITTTIAKLFA